MLPPFRPGNVDRTRMRPPPRMESVGVSDPRVTFVSITSSHPSRTKNPHDQDGPTCVIVPLPASVSARSRPLGRKPMNVSVTSLSSVIVPPAARERSTHVLLAEGGTALPSQFAGSFQLVPSPAPVQT